MLVVIMENAQKLSFDYNQIYIFMCFTVTFEFCDNFPAANATK